MLQFHGSGDVAGAYGDGRLTLAPGGRRAQLFEYRMSPDERALYDDVTDYLLSPTLHAFRGNARQLLLLGFHRRMVSSIPALAESLDRVASRLRGMLGEGDGGATAAAEFVRDLEEEDDIGEGGAETTSAPMPPLTIEAEGIRAELARVEDFVGRARALPRDSKAASLVQAVRMVMDRPADRRKVVIFTESLTTQDYCASSCSNSRNCATRTSRCSGATTTRRGPGQPSTRGATPTATAPGRRARRLPCALRSSTSFASAPRS